MTHLPRPVWHPSLCWAALALSLLLPAVRATAQAEPLRVAQPDAARFPRVTLYAARGPGGPRVEGDFRVTENGLTAQIEEVTSGGAILDVALALDRSPSMQEEGKFDRAVEAAGEFFLSLAGSDRGALVAFADTTALIHPLSADGASLARSLAPLRPTGEATALYDGVYWAVAQVALGPADAVVSAGPGRPEARRVVIALTDGHDLESRVTMSEVIAYARENGVAVCTVGLGKDAVRDDLNTLAAQTGGIYLEAPQPGDLRRLYRYLAEQLRRDYRIVYRSPRPLADGTRRDVMLEIAGGSGGRHAGTAWYQAPGQGSLLVTAPGAANLPAPSVTGGAGATAPAGAPWWIVPAAAAVLALGSGAALLLGLAARRRAVAPEIPCLWLPEGVTTVGRDAECDLVLESPEVSRLHARVERSGPIYRIIDAASRNGTYLNGRRVRARAEARAGDHVRFGDRQFRLVDRQP